MGIAEAGSTERATRRYVRSVMVGALLTAEREQALSRAWRSEGDEAALHELIRAHLRLSVSIAGRFRRYGLPLSDLVQEGNLGLMQAAQRFDPERSVRFSTYATWWIRAQIQDFVLRNWSIVRLGSTTSQKALFFNLRRLRARIAAQSPSASEVERANAIAAELGVSGREVEEMEARFAAGDRSLNSQAGETGEGDWQDFLACERDLPEIVVMNRRDSAHRRRLIHDALGRLSPRERTIIRERRLGEEATTLESLGQSLGISKERVRQIEVQALGKLRRTLQVHFGDSTPSQVFG